MTTDIAFTSCFRDEVGCIVDSLRNFVAPLAPHVIYFWMARILIPPSPWFSWTATVVLTASPIGFINPLMLILEGREAWFSAFALLLNLSSLGYPPELACYWAGNLSTGPRASRVGLVIILTSC